MKYNQLTVNQRRDLPTTYGIPSNADYVLHRQQALWKHSNTYALTFEDVLAEMDTALTIGLENYGSGMASWVIPEILKMPATANKRCRMFTLYLNQVCGDYSGKEITQFWNSIDAEKQGVINKKMDDYMDSCLGYLQAEF